MTDRYCVFVDAGYLYKAGGQASLNVEDRASQLLDSETFVPALSDFCNSEVLGGGGSWLRTYWYDGAPWGTPQPIHEEIGLLPRVKTRIGRLVRDDAGQFQQKGVDSLIVRDLVILAERTAISTAFLLGGDEDLREGVREAQDRGVEVVLLGIEPPKGSNLSETLVMEADQLLLVGQEVLRPHFSKPDFSTVAPRTTDPYEFGHRFAEAYVGTLQGFERRVVLRSRRWVPPHIDREIRQRLAGPSTFGTARPDLTRARNGFMQACKSLREADQAGT